MALRLIRRFSIKSPKDQNIIQGEKELIVPSDKYNKIESQWIPRPPKAVKVSLVGADTAAGRMAALFLKQHPLISKLYVHGKKDVEDLASDLNCIDSSCKVEAYWGRECLGQALRAADIVAMLDTDRKDENVERKFQSSWARVEEVAENYALHCPRAIFIVCVDPICCMVPLVQKIIECTPWYHPSKLLGSVAPIQNKLNALVGDLLYLDPTSIQLPLVGGPDTETVVPLVSLLNPNPWIDMKDAEQFYETIKEELIRRKEESKIVMSTVDEGFAIARLIITAAKGLCGEDDAITTAFVKTDVIQQLRYIVTTIQFGEGGIVKNFGIPHMSRFELENFEQGLLLLEEREKFVNDHFKRFEKILNYNRCT